jgi:hypothetical protein
MSSSEFDRQISSKPWKFLYDMIKNTLGTEFKYRIFQMKSLTYMPRIVTRYLSMFLQNYRGNVTIWPKLRLKDLATLFGYPTREGLEFAYYEGARITYPSKPV